MLHTDLANSKERETTPAMKWQNRAMGKGELASAYHPNSARGSASNVFNRDIHHNPELTEELQKTGY